MLQPQVNPRQYGTVEYDTLQRFISYWHQIDMVASANPDRILEVGLGNGFTSRYLRARGMDLVTADFDLRLGPSVVAELARGLPFCDKSFDVTVCFEVLEHLPWGLFGGAVAELARVSHAVIISLPDVTPFYEIRYALPLLGSGQTTFSVPWTRFLPWRRAPAHVFDGEHYWEVGKRGTEQQVVRRILERHGTIIRETRPALNPYHHFYRLQVDLA